MGRQHVAFHWRVASMRKEFRRQQSNLHQFSTSFVSIAPPSPPSPPHLHQPPLSRHPQFSLLLYSFLNVSSELDGNPVPTCTRFDEKLNELLIETFEESHGCNDMQIRYQCEPLWRYLCDKDQRSNILVNKQRKWMLIQPSPPPPPPGPPPPPPPIFNSWRCLLIP